MGVVEDTAVLLVFVVAFGALMFPGYFGGYSEATFVLYLAGILAVGLAYVVYFGVHAKPFHAVAAWLAMFALFPKKEINVEMETLLNVGFHATAIPFSLYDVLDIFFVGALLVALVAHPRKRVYASRPARFLAVAFVLLILMGTVHVVLTPRYPEVTEAATEAHVRSLLALWPLVEGVVVFAAARRFVRDPRQTEFLFRILIAGALLLLAEFILAKLELLPTSVMRYSFNYRDAFRSSLQRGDLFATLILLAGGAGSLFLFLAGRGRRYAALVVLFSWLVLETFNRASFYAYAVMVVVVLWRSSAWSRLRLAVGGAVAAVVLLVYSRMQRVAVTALLSSVLDVGRVRANRDWGFFDLGSTMERLGAIIRALDVVRYRPMVGAGPGNLVAFMSSPQVSPTMNSSVSNPASAQLYWEISTNIHPTNPHNLTVQLLGEYGIVALLAAAATTWLLIWGWHRMAGFRSTLRRDVYLVRLIAYAVLLGYAFFYVFQATPMVFGVMFLFVRLAAGPLEDPASHR
ncbi:MAG: O-antigen ligase family protein [Candidatus Binatia bacterium]